VKAGVHATRSAAAVQLICAGIGANQPLLEQVAVAVADSRRIREQRKALSEQWKPDDPPPPIEPPK